MATMEDRPHDHYGVPVVTKTVDRLVLDENLYRLMENDANHPCITCRRIIVACDHCAPISY